MSRDQTTTQWLRAAGNRIATGTNRICLICARRAAMKSMTKGRNWAAGVKEWLAESEGIAWLVKVGMLVGGALILRKIAIGGLAGLGYLAQSNAWRVLLWPAGALWLISAYRVGRPEWAPPADPEKPEEPEEPTESAQESELSSPAAEETKTEPAKTTVPLVKEPPLPSHQALYESLSRIGTPHAHIAALAADLETTAECVRAALAQLSVPVEDVRMRGRRSSTGVRADRFPTPSPAPGAPSEGVVGAGQSANNDNNNTMATVHREGLVIAYTDDVTNPVRTNVHVQTGA